jgi:transposase
VRDRTETAPPAIAVGLETPHGLLVDTLLEQGFDVFAINPKQLDRFRDRFSAGGAKDDRRDAHVLADSLRTDRRAFRAVHAADPAIIRLRELSRLLDDLQVQEGRLANRLRDQLSRVHAPWLLLNPAADDQWLWTLLRDTPHPDAWPQLPRRRIRSVLQAHRIRRLTADDVVAALRQPTLAVAPGVTDAAAIRIGVVIPQLLLVHEQRTMTERQIDRLLAQLAAADADEDERCERRDVEILQSLPGVGRVVTATMLAEAPGRWPIAIMARCAPIRVSPRSPSGAGNGSSPSRCATPVSTVCGRRSITGRGPASNATSPRGRTTDGCVRAATVMGGRFEAWAIGGYGF